MGKYIDQSKALRQPKHPDVLADIFINGLDSVNGIHGFHLKDADVTLKNFTDRFDEEVAGWSMNVTVWSSWDWDECAIPN